jgi:hypothetical protein
MSVEPRADPLLPASKMLRPSAMALMRAPSSMPESDSYIVGTRMISPSSMPRSGPVVVDGSVALAPPPPQAPREPPPPGAVYRPFKWQGYDPMEHYVRVCKRKVRRAFQRFLFFTAPPDSTVPAAVPGCSTCAM